jgi:hypothetical protein
LERRQPVGSIDYGFFEAAHTARAEPKAEDENEGDDEDD